MKYTVVLFDLDGTLIDSEEGILRSFAYALEKMGKGELSEKEKFRVIGPPLEYSFKEFFHLTEEEIPRAVAFYRERYREKGILECKKMAGAEELLKVLFQAGVPVLLATTKPELFARKILENMGWEQYFTAICGVDFEGKLKDKKDVICAALSRAKINDPSSAVIVGDRCYDVEGGKKAGVHTVGVKSGFAEEGELEKSGADFVFEDLFAVKKFLFEE